MRTSLVLVFAVTFTMTVGAQRSVPAPGAPRGTPQDVVARLLTFDANADGKITSAELNERLAALVARGDTNGDGGLDADEIRALVPTGLPFGRSGAGIAGGFSVQRAPGLRFTGPPRPSLAQGVEGVLSDLKLPDGRRDAAFAALAEHTKSGATDDAAVIKRIRAILTPQQFADFTAAYQRQQSLLQVAVINGQVVLVPPPPPPPPGQ